MTMNMYLFTAGVIPGVIAAGHPVVCGSAINAMLVVPYFYVQSSAMYIYVRIPASIAMSY